jgi:hypothetical protein
MTPKRWKTTMTSLNRPRRTLTTSRARRTSRCRCPKRTKTPQRVRISKMSAPQSLREMAAELVYFQQPKYMSAWDHGYLTKVILPQLFVKRTGAGTDRRRNEPPDCYKQQSFWQHPKV